VVAIECCEIVIANAESLSPRQELVEDLLAVVHTFSCRLNGLRGYEKKLKEGPVVVVELHRTSLQALRVLVDFGHALKVRQACPIGNACCHVGQFKGFWQTMAIRAVRLESPNK
jgi:hypothetical protein